MAYKPCDRIFAKVKGHPHWPARINILPEDVKVPKGKYPIFFYGTYEVYFLAPKDIFPYEKWKHKYAVNKSRPTFQKGLHEIENNPDVLLYGKDANAENFLSQFYDFKRSTQNDPPSDKHPPDAEISVKDDDNDTETKHSSNCTSPSKTDSVPKESKKRRLSSDHAFQPLSKRKTKETSLGSVEPKPSETQKTSLSVEPATQTKMSPTGTSSNKPDSLVKSKSPELGNGEAKLRKSSTSSKTSSSTTVKEKSSTPQATPATTALGRPVRKSASQFSAKKLLQGGMLVDDDENSSEDVDWSPSMDASRKDTTSDDDVSKTSTVLSTSLEPPARKAIRKDFNKKRLSKSTEPEDSRRLPSSSSGEESSLHPTDSNHNLHDNQKHQTTNERRQQQRRIRSPPTHQQDRSKPSKPPLDDKASTTSSQVSSATSARKPRLRPSNVSMSPEELSNRLANRPSQQNGQKQLKELGTEARLHFIDRAIKMSLIRGQEDIPTCLQRLESLEKLELTLPVLVKCNSIVETIRKCCRYKPSMDVKIAALKVFNRFLKVQENASKDEMEKAHAELMENNKRLQPSVSHLGPKSVEDLFQCVRRPSVGGDQAKSPAPQPTSPPPTQSASTSSDVASTAETLPQPPPPPPLPPPTSPSVSPPHPTSSDPSRLSPPRCPLDQSSIGVHNTTTSPQPENTGSGGSDSEGLAPSLGGLDGEESTDSDEEPVAPLLSKSSYNPFNVEATMAAVKQAFLQRTRDKSSAEPSNANKPQTASESDAYVPQPLHSCSVPLPAYVPCPTFPLSAFIPTSIAAPSTSSYQAPPPPPFPPFAADLSRPPPPMPPQEEFRHVDSRVSPEIRRRPTRQRAPSPHALPHPLEHYQKFLNNGESHPPPSITTRPLVQSGGDDLDTRIARLLEAAAPHLQQHQQPPSAILSPPPPPPPLPPSQNLILAHRPQPNVLAEPPAYTPDSPVQDGINGGQDFDPLNVWPPQRGRGGEDVYKTLDI